MAKLFLQGEPLVLPVTIGFSNLSPSQQEDALDQGWDLDDFGTEESFWEFDGVVCWVEQDCSAITRLSILHDSEFECGFTFGNRTFGVKFQRDDRYFPNAIVLTEIFPNLNGDTLLETERGGEFFLPDVLSDYEATQCVEELSKHEYGNGFEAESSSVSQVIKDLAVYSNMGDEDFDELRSEPFESEILPKLFEDCRNSKINDLQDVLSKFFDTHLGRTL
jgi:hypothetical protein